MQPKPSGSGSKKVYLRKTYVKYLVNLSIYCTGGPVGEFCKFWGGCRYPRQDRLHYYDIIKKRKQYEKETTVEPEGGSRVGGGSLDEIDNYYDYFSKYVYAKLGCRLLFLHGDKRQRIKSFVTRLKRIVLRLATN